ncbi:MAG: hypothetical protein GF400_07980 [Candidatus Eisenbacteria bacterium]|nr:hypothetical protein [Candidatus Eisenbacteria bacterium]
MNGKNRTLFGLALLGLLLVSAGCGRDTSTTPAEASTDPVVFGDNFGDAVDYQAFMGSKLDAVQMDFTEAYEGDASLRVTVPGPGAQDGTFAGGAFTTFNTRDLSGYNALSFYAKSSMNSTLDVAGLGNDNTGTSLYEASRSAISLTTDWERVIIPVPDPSKLTDEGGLFYYAEGYENNMGYDFWMDEIRFVNVQGITNPRPVMDTKTEMTFVGGFVEVTGTSTTFDLGREDVVIDHLPAYFDYISSSEAVAIVTDGTINAVGSGDATVTAELDTVDVDGAVTVNVFGGPDGPATAPTEAEEDVISLFSDGYDDVTVDTWHAPWTGSTGEVTDFQIQGDNVKLYTDLNFAGIEFTSEPIDAATPGMTHLHLDVWAPSGGLFKVKLVDFGANGVWDGGGDDSEYELMFNGGTEPPFFSGQWSPLDIPLSDFVGLASTEHLAQMVISSSDVNTVIVDNVYFHK